MYGLYILLFLVAIVLYWNEDIKQCEKNCNKFWQQLNIQTQIKILRHIQQLVHKLLILKLSMAAAINPLLYLIIKFSYTFITWNYRYLIFL